MPDATRIGVQTGNELSLTLQQAIEMALKNSNDIDESRNDVHISDFGLMGARGVYDPLATSDNYYEKLTTPTASAIGGAVNGAVTTSRYFGSAGLSGYTPYQGGNYSASFNTSRATSSNTNSFLNPQFPSTIIFSYAQPLWRNRSIDANRHAILIAKKNVDLSDSQLRQKAMDIIAGVEQAYWDLAYALRNLEVQIDTLKQAREQLESNERQVAQGVLAPIEIVAARAQISTYEQAVYSAQESITRAENALKPLILSDRTSPEWMRPLTPVSPVDLDVPRMGLDVATAEAMKNRPEIEQLQINADINKVDQRFFKNQTKPQIDLVGTYTGQGLAGTETPAAISPVTGLSRVPPGLVGGLPRSITQLGAFDFPSYHIGVNISLPIGNRVARANFGRALVQGDRIANQRAQTEQTVEADVRNALQALRSAESRLASAIDGRVAADELYTSEQRQFRAGTSTFYLVLQRQTALNVARGLEIQARTTLDKAISTFQRSIGSTLTVNNVTVTK